MPNDLHNRVIAKILERHSGPLIDNLERGVYVECMIEIALGDAWRLPEASWEAWDLEHPATCARIEVKQSAAQQVMLKAYKAYSGRTSFSIAPKQGYWNPEWTRFDPPSRAADIYVFAWHPIVGEQADHRRADQWEFYVVRESDLPNQKTIGLNPLKRLAQAVSYDGLAGAVEEARRGLAPLKKDTLP